MLRVKSVNNTKVERPWLDVNVKCNYDILRAYDALVADKARVAPPRPCRLPCSLTASGCPLRSTVP